MSTNFVETLVWKHECDVTNSALQTQITTMRHSMNPPIKIFCVRHWPCYMCTTVWLGEAP